MKLPNAAQALVEREKITEYLLSATHPSGRSKARFFRRFGFSTDSWDELADSLRLQAILNDVAEVEDTEYGLRYNVDGIIEAPDGRSPLVRTVWQFDSDNDYPRLVTAFPHRR